MTFWWSYFFPKVSEEDPERKQEIYEEIQEKEILPKDYLLNVGDSVCLIGKTGRLGRVIAIGSDRTGYRWAMIDINIPELDGSIDFFPEEELERV